MKVIITQEELNAAVIAFFGLPLDATVVLEGCHTINESITQPVSEQVVEPVAVVVEEEVKQVRTRRSRTKKQNETVDVVIKEIKVKEPEVIIDSPIVEIEAIELEVDAIKEVEKKNDSSFQFDTTKEDSKPIIGFKESNDSPFCESHNENKKSDSKATSISNSPFFFNVTEEEKQSVAVDLAIPYANEKPLFS